MLLQFSGEMCVIPSFMAIFVIPSFMAIFVIPSFMAIFVTNMVQKMMGLKSVHFFGKRKEGTHTPYARAQGEL